MRNATDETANKNANKEEWTTVSRRRGHVKRGRKTNRRKSVASDGEYGTHRNISSSSTGSKKVMNPQIFVFDDVESDEVTLYNHVLACMDGLSQTQFFQNVLHCFSKANVVVHKNLSSSSNENGVETHDNSLFAVEDIVCLGVGNFGAVYRGSFSAPMLQLALVLLLRAEFYSTITTKSNASEVEGGRTTFSGVIEVMYCEPLMNTVEEAVLRMFSVDVIPNDFGKRRIKGNNKTLFFLPHCPMRLYSNVVWANWDSDLVRNVVLFGNSFLAYDERIVNSEDRNDATNCIFQTIPYVHELPVLLAASNDDKLRNMEQAFNDSCVIRFAPESMDHVDLGAVDHPPEYFVFQENDELLA